MEPVRHVCRDLKPGETPAVRGTAQASQAKGREFESRLPLQSLLRRGSARLPRLTPVP